MRITIFTLLSLVSFYTFSQDTLWKAQWITAIEQQNETNNWTAYQKSFELENLPDEALAKIACDSKYWMWINGELK